ncbi:MAG: hypothetical protein ACRC33_04570 [Gemmataceae bacterium]
MTMLPDGIWAGFWQAADEDPFDNVHDLRLAFAGEAVAGGGEDMVGRFTLEGTARAGGVEVVKQYAGAHAVRYRGEVDADGCVAGRWEIGGDCSGRFLWVPPGADPTPLVERWVRGTRRG